MHQITPFPDKRTSKLCGEGLSQVSPLPKPHHFSTPTHECSEIMAALMHAIIKPDVLGGPYWGYTAVGLAQACDGSACKTRQLLDRTIYIVSSIRYTCELCSLVKVKILALQRYCYTIERVLECLDAFDMTFVACESVMGSKVKYFSKLKLFQTKKNSRTFS